MELTHNIVPRLMTKRHLYLVLTPPFLLQAEFAATDSDKQITRAADIAADADKTLASVRDSSEKAKAIVTHVAELATGLELSQQPKVDSALAEARQIKVDIAGM